MPDGQSGEKAGPPFRYVHSANFPDLLAHLGVTVLATTFQAGRVLSFSGINGKCSLLARAFPHPMGLATDTRRMALVCSNQVWFMANQPDLVDREGTRVPYDAYYVPRRSHVTGDIAGHEAAWGAPTLPRGARDLRAEIPDAAWLGSAAAALPRTASGAAGGADVATPSAAEAFSSSSVAAASSSELWVVNTRFSCLCTLHPDFSFVPRWKLPFVSQLAAEDRCHLNGLGLHDRTREPQYATVLARTDAAQGWRDHKITGGAVLDIASGEPVTTGLAMPHSPRVHRGRLYVLDSGRAEFQEVDAASGRRTTIARVPGFVRGLVFHGGFAFMGLSRAREHRTFGGLPIEEFIDTLECGIYAIDLASGGVAGFIRFESGCDELFDVQVLPNRRRVNVVGFSKDTINGIFVLPRGATAVADRAG